MAQTDEEARDVTGQEAEPGTGAARDEADAPVLKKLKAPATRRRVSGVELESRFDDWVGDRRARRSERTPEEAARMLRRGAGVALGAAGLALVIAFGAMNGPYESQRSGDQDRITSLQTQVEQARAVPEDTGAARLLTEVSGAASADGKKVAEAQQAFADLHYRISTEPDPGNGAPNQAAVDMAEHRRVLAPHFDPSAFIADDKDAYIWQNVLPYDEARQIDPRYAWYVRYDGEDASPASASTWSLETVTPQLDPKSETAATDRASVVWLCRDAQTGAVLAWARSTYTYDAAAKKGAFRDLDLVITAEGAAHRQSSSPKQDAKKGGDR